MGITSPLGTLGSLAFPHFGIGRARWTELVFECAAFHSPAPNRTACTPTTDNEGIVVVAARKSTVETSKNLEAPRGGVISS